MDDTNTSAGAGDPVPLSGTKRRYDDWSEGISFGKRSRGGGRAGGMGGKERTDIDTAPARVHASEVAPAMEDEHKIYRPAIPTEESVGITEYISKSSGFDGVIKLRYSDFIVREIALNGTVVTLRDESATMYTDSTSGIVAKAESGHAMADASMVEKVGAVLKLCGEASLKDFVRFLYLNKIISSDDASAVDAEFAVVDADVDGEPSMPSVTLPAPEAKEDRRAFHHTLREIHASLDSQIVDTPNSVRAVRVTYKQGKDMRRRWPEGRPDFLQFVLCKQNYDTASAINTLARMLACSDRSFGYAGIKDRRGVTTQLVTLYRTEAARVIGAARKLLGMKVGDFSYTNRRLRLGDLAGNRFTIVIKKLSVGGATTELTNHITSCLEAWKDAGYRFVNYFGLQRFGRGDSPTHLIGRCLLTQDWLGAVHMVLRPREGEKDEQRALRQFYMETKNAEETLAHIPPFWYIEQAVLEELHARGGESAPGAACCAIGAIATRQRNLYIHSFQSFLWNKMCSQRIRLYGSIPAVGDMVLCDSAEMAEDEVEETADAPPLPAVHILSESDVSSGKFTIDQVVLPVPGYEVQFPQHGCGAAYLGQILQEAGIDLPVGDPAADLEPAIKNLWKPKDSRYQARGAYRKVFVGATDVEYAFSPYSAAGDVVAPTDFEAVTTNEVGTTGTNLAIAVSFSLPRSAYATIALREIMKRDTAMLE